MKTLVEKIHEYSISQPDHLAMVMEDEAISYGELWESVCSAAVVLKNHGVKAGNVVVVQSTYTKYYPVLIFATHLIGAVFASADKNAAPDLLIDFAQKLKAVIIISNAEVSAFNSLSFRDFRDAIVDKASAEEYCYPNLDGVADILFTTGTTGTPKGVVLTHRNIVSRAIARATVTQLKKNNVTVSLSPLNHHAAMLQTNVNIYNGSTMIFLDSIMQLNKMFKYIPLYNITSIYLPPANVSLIEKLSRGKLAEYKDVIEFAYISSASIRENQKMYMKSVLPDSRLYYSYGSSETGPVAAFDFNHDHNTSDCVGKPCEEVTVAIVDDDFNPVKEKEIGRIAIKSDMNFKEYYENPELTNSVYKNGYFLTNDIGFIDDDGYLHVKGRADDMINISGLKVFPDEIENKAMELDEVQECVCFAVKDSVTGQIPKLLIVPNPSLEPVDLKVVVRKLSKKMDAYKVPKYIDIIESVERTNNGKINRKYYSKLEEK